MQRTCGAGPFGTLFTRRRQSAGAADHRSGGFAGQFWIWPA